MKKYLLMLTAVALLTTGAQVCNGEDGWDFSISPYVWLVGISGDIGPEANPASVDVQFTDLLDRVDWGFIGAVEGNYNNKWLTVLEGIYAELDESGNAPKGGPSKITAIGGPLDVEMDMSLGTAFIGYRVDGKVVVDYLLGARWLYTKSYLKFPKVITKKQDWIDPVVGVRVSGKLGKKIGATLEADIGGFGVGSELVWQMLPTISYQFNDKLASRLGYRYLDIDYEKNSYALDVQFQGWLAGVVYNF